MECELGGITVHYEARGEGRPIVILHGWGCDHRHVLADMEPLFGGRDGWQRIYPDLPGHGMTPGRDWIASQDDMLGVVLDLIDRVVPGQRLVIGGTSAGAYLARGVVHRRSASIDGLLQVVPLVVHGARRRVPPQATLVADPALAAQLATDDADYFEMAVVQSRKVADYVRANLTPASQMVDEDFLAKIRDVPENYAFSFDVDALPKPFLGPTLIVTGRQDAVVGYRDAWEILENYPRATFAVLDRSGHFLASEQEDLFHALASDWLDRVEEYSARQAD
jgi:pimeloyl-ACP methyl ester carboxylesterase